MHSSHGYYYWLCYFILTWRTRLCYAVLGWAHIQIYYLDHRPPLKRCLFPYAKQHYAELRGDGRTCRPLSPASAAFPLVGRLLGAHRAATDFRGPFSRSLCSTRGKALTARQEHPGYNLIASKQMVDSVSLAKSPFFFVILFRLHTSLDWLSVLK